MGASFGAAVQLSVGPRRYPRRATQESSSFQEHRDLHLTPARFRSRGRLFWRHAINRLDERNIGDRARPSTCRSDDLNYWPLAVRRPLVIGAPQAGVICNCVAVILRKFDVRFQAVRGTRRNDRHQAQSRPFSHPAARTPPISAKAGDAFRYDPTFGMHRLLLCRRRDPGKIL